MPCALKTNSGVVTRPESLALIIAIILFFVTLVYLNIILFKFYLIVK